MQWNETQEVHLSKVNIDSYWSEFLNQLMIHNIPFNERFIAICTS